MIEQAGSRVVLPCMLEPGHLWHHTFTMEWPNEIPIEGWDAVSADDLDDNGTFDVDVRLD